MSQIQRSDLQPEPSTVHALRENWPLPAAKRPYAVGSAAGKYSEKPSAKGGRRQRDPARGPACEVNGGRNGRRWEKKKLSLPAATKKKLPAKRFVFPAIIRSNLDARAQIKEKEITLCRRPREKAAGKGHFFPQNVPRSN